MDLVTLAWPFPWYHVAWNHLGSFCSVWMLQRPRSPPFSILPSGLEQQASSFPLCSKLEKALSQLLSTILTALLLGHLIGNFMLFKPGQPIYRLEVVQNPLLCADVLIILQDLKSMRCMYRQILCHSLCLSFFPVHTLLSTKG